MNKVEAIIKLFPNAKPGIDFTVRDDSDGNGQYIEAWNLTEPQPTVAELQAAWEQVKDVPPAPSLEEQLKQLQQVVNDLIIGGMGL